MSTVSQIDTPLNRIFTEKEELDARLKKLFNYMGSDEWNGLSIEDKSLLSNQSHIMTEYSNILRVRYQKFGKNS